MVAALLTGWAAAQECPVREEVLEEARQALVLVEFDELAVALRRFEESLSCGPIATRRELARFWVLDGARWWFTDDPAQARRSLLAARETDPHVFVDSVGAEVRSAWDQAAPASGEAFVLTLPEIPLGTAWLDGQAVDLPASVRPGLHVLVVGAEDSLFGRVVTVEAGVPSVVELPPDAVPAAPAADPPRAPLLVLPPPWEPARRGFALSAGTGLLLGAPTRVLAPDGREHVEHFARPTLDLEVERRWITSRATFDVDLQASLLLTGQFLWSTAGAGGAWPGGGGGTVGAGLRSGPWTLGLRGGVFLPGRIPIRYCLRRELGKEELELRVGLNLVTQRAPEFATELRVMLPVLGQQHRGLPSRRIEAAAIR